MKEIPIEIQGELSVREVVNSLRAIQSLKDEMHQRVLLLRSGLRDGTVYTFKETAEKLDIDPEVARRIELEGFQQLVQALDPSELGTLIRVRAKIAEPRKEFLQAQDFPSRSRVKSYNPEDPPSDPNTTYIQYGKLNLFDPSQAAVASAIVAEEKIEYLRQRIGEENLNKLMGKIEEEYSVMLVLGPPFTGELPGAGIPLGSFVNIALGKYISTLEGKNTNIEVFESVKEPPKPEVRRPRKR